MIASLPMYDRPETADANDRLWQLIREGLPDSTPDALSRDVPDLMAHWQSPDLILSQTCGFPYRARLAGKVSLVATPVLNLDCPDGYYYSVIIAHKDRQNGPLTQFDGAKIAYNDPMSQSGWAALYEYLTDAGLSFGSSVETGAHHASASAVAQGCADLAAVDALTWQMICKWDSFADDLCVVARTPPTPTLPYICAPSMPRGTVAQALSKQQRPLALRIKPRSAYLGSLKSPIKPIELSQYRPRLPDDFASRGETPLQMPQNSAQLRNCHLTCELPCLPTHLPF